MWFALDWHWISGTMSTALGEGSGLFRVRSLYNADGCATYCCSIDVFACITSLLVPPTIFFSRQVLAFPSSLTPSQLAAAAPQRSRSRVPALVWLHPASKAPLVRSSQPMAGMTTKVCPAVPYCIVSWRGIDPMTSPPDRSPVLGKTPWTLVFLLAWLSGRPP